jgi:hypothetical protein
MTTLSDDVYSVIDGGKEIDESLYKDLAEDLTNTIRNRLSDKDPVRKTLGLSSVGKPLRRLWYDFHSDIELVKPSPSMRLKFLFGDIIEDLLLWLVKVSGHSVTDRQKEVKVGGVIGHIDSIIDGEVVDIKSASPRSFLKFSGGHLPEDDPFGYLAQITAYDKVVGKGNPGFLVMNKVTGEICDYRPDPIFDMPDVDSIIEKAKEVVASDTPPDELCYEPVPDGTSGNMKIAAGCEYCPYKDLCFPGVRKFKYANGVRYLTKVVKEPKVEEIKENVEES